MSQEKPPAIIPGPPGYVMISLSDLSELLKGVRPSSLPDTVHVRYFVQAREMYSMRTQLTRYQSTWLPLVGEGYPRLELTLGG